MTATTETPTDIDWKADARSWQERARQAEERSRILRAEVSSLRAERNGDAADAQSWLQSHAARQRQALDRLNRKVVTQRFRLNLLRTLGRDVTYDEYMAAREGVARVEEYEDLT